MAGVIGNLFSTLVYFPVAGWVFAFDDNGMTGWMGTLIFVNTMVCPAAGILGWILVEHFRHGKATAVGAASGAVAGLVAITPACITLTPVWAIALACSPVRSALLPST